MLPEATVKSAPAPSAKVENIIEVRGLRVEYTTDSGKRIEAVRGLDLAVQPGEVVGFIGPNGAGKSTTIKCLMGFRAQTEGDIRIFGMKPGDVRMRRRIGFLPEVALYYPFLTARETLRMFAKLSEVPKAKREPMIDDLLRKVGLSGRDKEAVRGFSKGMLQRVGIAQAIMGEPDLLILDEVTSGLDPVARYDVRRILLDFKAKGKTVFFSSHELSEVTMLCDRVILIDEGRVLIEDKLDNIVRAIRRHIIRTERMALPQTLPEHVWVSSVRDEYIDYMAETPEARDALLQLLAQLEAKVIEHREESGSLEDFFVSKIGHKVT